MSELWQACRGEEAVRPKRLEAWRVVEGQHVVSTRKLVDSDAEQELLEELIDGVKPPRPPGAEFAGLHYLLYTPFRHPPLRYGSRFGRRSERGIWYGSREVRTALAEAAYYRLLFLEGSAAPLGPLTLTLSAFRAAIAARRWVDLTAPPFAAHEATLASPTSYAVTQPLGAAMRGAAVEGFSFRSARDQDRGTNVGLFGPVFARATPGTPDTWTCTATREVVEARNWFSRERWTFPRAQFVVGGELPHPGL